MAKIGDYVTAKLIGKEECRQGVFLAANDILAVICSETGEHYHCEPNVIVVPDHNILHQDTRDYVAQIRTALNVKH